MGEGARGAGAGAALMGHLFDLAREAGVHVMVGAVDADNEGSLRFHERLGFSRVGHFHEVGRKFGRWLDLVFVEKLFYGLNCWEYRLLLRLAVMAGLGPGQSTPSNYVRCPDKSLKRRHVAARDKRGHDGNVGTCHAKLAPAASLRTAIWRASGGAPGPRKGVGDHQTVRRLRLGRRRGRNRDRERQGFGAGRSDPPLCRRRRPGAADASGPFGPGSRLQLCV